VVIRFTLIIRLGSGAVLFFYDRVGTVLDIGCPSPGIHDVALTIDHADEGVYPILLRSYPICFCLSVQEGL